MTAIIVIIRTITAIIASRSQITANISQIEVEGDITTAETAEIARSAAIKIGFRHVDIIPVMDTIAHDRD